MKHRTQIVKTYRATKCLHADPKSTDHREVIKFREVIKIGACGQGFGHVRCIETGETWGTYGYNFLEEVGKLECTTTYKRV